MRGAGGREVAGGTRGIWRCLSRARRVLSLYSQGNNSKAALVSRCTQQETTSNIVVTLVVFK